jgi:hypothetical protein
MPCTQLLVRQGDLHATSLMESIYLPRSPIEFVRKTPSLSSTNMISWNPSASFRACALAALNWSRKKSATLRSLKVSDGVLIDGQDAQ